MAKKRFLDRHDTSEAFEIIGDVRGKSAVIIDDVISTGGTITNGTKSLCDAGASSVTVLATHGVFAGDAPTLLGNAKIDHFIITDTITNGRVKVKNHIEKVSVAPLIADAIITIIK